MNVNEEQQLDDLLADWELARESGRSVTVEQLCADAPQLVDALAERVAKLSATSWMLVDHAEGHDDQVDSGQSIGCGLTIDASNEPTISDFITSVLDSGILADDQIQQVKSDAKNIKSGSAKQLAQRLIIQNILTEYQAQTLLSGGNSPLLLDRYIILDALGSGGMGLVFKALHRSMERIVAIKVLPQYAVDSPEKVKRFQREVKAAAKISHPNVVTAYDAHERNGTHFLVMEYIDGCELGQHVQQHGPMTVSDALQVVRQVAMGLAAAHDQGMVHRDVKPTNIMLANDGTAKLLDLGLARTMQLFGGAGEPELTKDGLAMGTAAYMSPEQALDAKQADERSDLYSLGYTLYFLLTGQPPYPRNTVVQTIVAHREAPTPSLQQARSDVSDDVEAVFQKMVHKVPEQRTQDVAELVAELNRIDSAASDQTSVNIRPRPKSKSKSASHSNRRWPMLAAGAIAVAIACFAVLQNWVPRDPDVVHRDLAKWAVNSNGIVVAQTELGEQEFHASSDIPDAPFRITGLDLYSDSDNLSIDSVFEIDTLETLSLTGLQNVDMQRCSKLSKLTSLTLLGCNVTDSDLRHLTSLAELSSLTVSDCEISDDGLAYIASCPNLSYLDVARTSITGKGVELLKVLPNLSYLDLSETSVGGPDLEHLPPNLNTLYLSWCDIDDTDAASLQNLKLLEVLDVQETQLTDKGVVALSSLDQLYDLELSGLKISEDGIKQLSNFRALVFLGLSGMPLTDGHVSAIASLNRLQDLDLSYTKLDDAGLQKLQSLRRLESLYVDNTKVTQQGIDQFYRKHPQCVVFADEDAAGSFRP